MGNRRKSQGVQVKYAFIKAPRSEFDTAVMCHLLDVSHSGSMNGCVTLSPIERWRISVLGLIRTAYTASHGVYGGPWIFLDLREAARSVASIWSLGL